MSSTQRIADRLDGRRVTLGLQHTALTVGFLGDPHRHVQHDWGALATLRGRH